MTTKIEAYADAVCEVNVENLHHVLLELPAEKYLDLYNKMHRKIYGYPPHFGFCNCGGIEDNQNGA